MNFYRLLLPLNLQFFAADGGAAGAGGSADAGGAEPGQANNNPDGGQPQSDNNPSEPTEPKTFTQEDVDKIISTRLAKERQKWEKDFQNKLDEAKTEAEKLAKMNADQKAEYERQKREEELAKREQEITRRELRAEALETLAEKGLPKTLADILNYSSAEETNKSIESVEKAFREAVEQAVNERLKGDTVKKGNQGQQNDIAETISKIFQQ